MVLNDRPKPLEQIQNVEQGLLDCLDRLVFILLLVLKLHVHPRSLT